MNYNYLLPLIILWQLLLTILNLKMYSNIDLNKNIIHALHALIYVSLYYLQYYDTLINFTISFYIYDILFILFTLFTKKKQLSDQKTYLIHHIISIYIFDLAYNGVATDYIVTSGNVLEISNFSIYLAYHAIKTSDNKFINLLIQSFQFVWYSYFRIVVFGIYIINNREPILKLNYFILSLTTMFYLMGMFWSYALYNKILKYFIKNFN